MQESPYEPNWQEPRGLNDLPEEVKKLFGREQEIALIVYTRGCATAKEVEQRTTTCISNAAVRSMLERLVTKQILARVRTGERGAYVYLPGITRAASAERALKRFASDYFGGSLRLAAHGMLDVLRKKNLSQMPDQAGTVGHASDDALLS